MPTKGCPPGRRATSNTPSASCGATARKCSGTPCPKTEGRGEGYPWYPESNGIKENLIGDAGTQDLQFNTSYQWNSASKLFGAAFSYGVDLEYLNQGRDFSDIQDTFSREELALDYAMGNGLVRFKWNVGEKKTMEAAAGASVVYQSLFEDQDPGLKTVAPLASLRYTRPLLGNVTGFGELAIRENTSIQPTGFNRIEAVTTSSAEGKLGTEAAWTDAIKMTASLYSRFYKDPALPTPEIFWNYAETHSSDYAYANGGNVTVAWLPSHHFGMNVNASVVQGDYHLENGGHLPWEANRSLDLVSNIRILPRRDSLLSFIVTYGANNDAPLYEYTGLYDLANRRSTETEDDTASTANSKRFPASARTCASTWTSKANGAPWNPCASSSKPTTSSPTPKAKPFPGWAAPTNAAAAGAGPTPTATLSP